MYQFQYVCICSRHQLFQLCRYTSIIYYNHSMMAALKWSDSHNSGTMDYFNFPCLNLNKPHSTLINYNNSTWIFCRQLTVNSYHNIMNCDITEISEYLQPCLQSYLQPYLQRYQNWTKRTMMIYK